MTGLHGERSCLPVAGDRAVDQPGIDGTELFIANAQLIHDTRPELLDYDVVFHDQLFDSFDGSRFFQVQEHGLFVPSQPGLCAGHLRPFDHRRPVDHQIILVAAAHLEHLRTQICQCHCGIRARK